MDSNKYSLNLPNLVVLVFPGERNNVNKDVYI